MSDYEAHPDDNNEFHTIASLVAIAKAKQSNRFYVFPMNDRVEIAFGNSRHSFSSDRLQIQGDGHYVVDYHSAISMNYSTLKELHSMISRLIEEMESEDGE